MNPPEKRKKPCPPYFFLPFPCPACKNNFNADSPNALCVECLEKINFVRAPFCPGCGGALDGVLELCSKCLREEKRLWRKAVSVFELNGEGRNLLHRFKYKNSPELARPLGQAGAAAIQNSGLDFDIIVPVPLHWTRFLERGFNQAALIAEIISSITGKPVKNILKRTKRTPKQAKLTRKQRKKNLIGAFSLKKWKNCEKHSILLIDDVMTTGSTLSSAAEILLKNGAAEINVFVLARR
jgi:ComF family protein